MRPKHSMMNKKEQGLSIVGLLIAVVISGILMNGLISVFSSNQNTSRMIHDFGSLQENIRAANDMLEISVRQVGHFGGVMPENITAHTSLNLQGVGSCDHSWLTDTTTTIQAYDGGANTTALTGLPNNCIVDTEYTPNTDVLSIKYASAMEMTPYASLESDGIYVRTVIGSGEEIVGQIFKGSEKATTIGTIGSDPVGTYNYQYINELYYIRSCSQKVNDACQDTIPSLVRYQLDNGVFTEHVLVAGVEQFQVEFGLDTNGNLTADTYASASSITNWDQVTSIKYSLVVRGNNKDTVIKDTKSYSLVGGVDFTAKVDDQNYRRRAYTKVVQLRNMTRG